MRRGGRRRRKYKGQRCHYCGGVATTKDHIWPRALGGGDGLWNLTPSCLACNSAKGAQVPTCPCRKCRAAARRGAILARNEGIPLEPREAS